MEEPNASLTPIQGTPTIPAGPAEVVRPLDGLEVGPALEDETDDIPIGVSEEELSVTIVPGPSPDEVEDPPPTVPEPKTLATPPLGINFEGVRSRSAPGDPHLAVGPNHVLEAVNGRFRVSDKNGRPIFSRTLRWFWSNHPGRVPFDPWVAYDHFQDRWVMLTVTHADRQSDGWYCLGVSQSGDPTGAWWRRYWRADFDGTVEQNAWADYPKFAFDDARIYITSNHYR